MSWPLVALSKTKHFFENSTSFLKLVIFINSMCMLCTARADTYLELNLIVPYLICHIEVAKIATIIEKFATNRATLRCELDLYIINENTRDCSFFVMFGWFCTVVWVPPIERNSGCESGITCLYTDLSQQRPQPHNNALGTVTPIFVFFAETTGDRALGNRRYQI